MAVMYNYCVAVMYYMAVMYNTEEMRACVSRYDEST